MTRKIIAIILILTLLLGKSASSVALATEATPAGEAQPAQEAQTWDDGDKADKEDKPDKGEAKPAGEATSAQEANGGPTITPSPTPAALVTETTTEVEHGGTNANGNIGDTSIDSGDANNTGAIINNTNMNAAGTGAGTGTTGGVSIANTDNGAGSDNNGSATIVDNNDTNQNNSAVIINNMTQASITGDNSASENIGNSTINTGDANVSGTVITAANTNVDGVAISEFNIVDDHFGDFILDFGANCIAGCGGDTTSLANIGNGADSDNTASSDTTTNNNTNQNNDGTVTNNIDFVADSGNNETSRNTGGDSSITTGDANVAASLVTFLNNNIAGNVVFGVVNIFGDLVGDIIMPDDVFNQFACSTCGGDTNITNANNGAGSDNNGSSTNTTNNNIFQANDANIANNLILEAETGENSASKNNQGDVNITTGNTSVDASILNIANMNMIGGNMWLVIVNEAGNWVGKLFGAPEGSVLAGSEGLEFAVDPNGTINVTNAQNGAGSTNNGDVNNTTNNNLNQTNTANVVNNVNLSANTGGNEADKNNGNVDIVTGDAQAIANIVNFVNNNIAGGKLLVTFVNVFGSWNGDFMTPGSHKDNSPVVAQGGQENNNSNNQGSNNNSNSSSTSVAAKGPSIIAAAGFIPNALGFGSNDDSKVEVKVAGANTNDIVAGLTKDSSDKKATLNLAWILLATPLLAIGMLARKKFLKKTV
ncbi:MAG: hypothetical protein KBD51_03630 [Candidatus Levybacteria bacterium]|nr:hypothetical protein [Candidatus Levybacteria bacterium]